MGLFHRLKVQSSIAPVSSRQMVPFLKQYFKALAVVAGMMLSYWIILVPWIQPEESADYAIPSFTAISSSYRWWEPIFQGQDWEVGQPTVVHSSRGVLLAKTWEQVDQKTWKLTPLTIVMTPIDTEELADDPGEKSTDVWVVRALNGATIHFDQPLDLNSGTVPGIQRGRLEGQIDISKVSLDQPSEIKVQLRTSNVSIDRRQIWTEEEVVLQSKDLVVQGRVLKIGLSSDILSRQDPSEERANSSNGPLEEIELMHLTRMEMGLQPGGLWSGINPDLLKIEQPIDQMPATIRAQCGGRFTLNLRRQIATLSNGVHLWHALGSLPPDEFHCHRVQIRFQSDSFQSKSESDPSSVKTAINRGKELSRDILENLNIREIEAFGIDSLENLVGEMWVELKSPTIAASARAKRIRYDVSRQRFELAGRLNHPKSTVSVAELNFQGHHLRAPLLEYQASPRGDDNQPSHAGWMVAQGPGELSSPADSAVGEFHVRWQEHLHWAPAEKEGGQWIEVSGKTFVESKNWGFITADNLQLWLSDSSASAAESSVAPIGKSFQPQRLLAKGSPQVQAGQARLSVESIDLRFLYPTVDLSKSSDEMTLKDASGNSLFQFLNQPPAQGSASESGGSSAQWKAPPVEINGTQLNATVLSVGGVLWFDSMTLGGPLSLKTLPAQDAVPLEVVGSSLVMATSPKGEVDLEVYGEPAKILFADGSIQGPSVRFNQRENHIWIDHPGECVLPSREFNGLGQNLVSFAWALPLRCAWKGRMTFDGKNVRCDGGIRINGAMSRADDVWIVEAFCERLDMELAAPISFKQMEPKSLIPSRELAVSVSMAAGRHTAGPLANVAEVAQISLQEQVDIRVAQRDSSGQRISLQRLEVPAATIYVPQQKIVAIGPGKGMSKFISRRSPSTSSNQTKADTLPIQCAHLLFRDNLVTFLDRNEVVVEGNVRVLSSPISSWDESFDPLGLSALSLGQMSLSCDQLKLVDTQSLSTIQSRSPGSEASKEPLNVWEMQATGSVVFEGSVESGQYAGNAYQVTYVQAKDLVTFRGDGRSKALLQRKPPPGNTASYQTVKEVIEVPIATLNLKTMGVEVPQGGLDVRVDFQQDGATIGPLSTEGNGSSNSSAPSRAPNPRDGYKNFLRGY